MKTTHFFGLSTSKHYNSEIPRFNKKNGMKIFIGFCPYDLNSDEKRYAIDSVKAMSEENHDEISVMMCIYINRLRELLQINSKSLNDYVILFAPSKSKFMKELYQYITLEYPHIKVYNNAFRKNLMSELQLNYKILNRECERSQKYVPKYFQGLIHAKKNMPAKISYINASLRRYVLNLVSLIIPSDMILYRGILVLDDTFGEGATFTNINNVLKKYKCEEIIYSAFMRDFVNNA